MRVPAGLRLIKYVTLVTTSVVRDTPPDCHFSAWSRPKPAPDPLPRPSVASGVIPTKGGRNGVLQPPAGRAPQGRWRSSPWKRCNHAAPRGRGQGAPRTARCIKTSRPHPTPARTSRQGAPRTARCIKTPRPGASTRGHGRSGATPHFCVTSSPPHGRTTVTSSKGSNRPGPSPLAATTHRGTFCAEREVLRTK